MRSGDRRLQKSSLRCFQRPVLIDVAHGCMRLRHWGDAAWLLEQVPSRDAAVELKRLLAQNLASLQQYRPDIYALVSLPTGRQLRHRRPPAGRPTIVVRKADGSRMSLSAGPDPLAALCKRSTGSAKQARASPWVCAASATATCCSCSQAARPSSSWTCSSRSSSSSPMPRCSCSALMIHDYSGLQGPIESAALSVVCWCHWRGRT